MPSFAPPQRRLAFGPGWRCFALCGLVLGGLVAESVAAPVADTVPESVWLEGKRLLGLRIEDGADGAVRLVVRRAWLEKHAPDVYRRSVKSEQERERGVTEKLRERLKAWREDRMDEKAVVGYLDRQLERLEKQLQPVDPEAPRKQREPPQLLIVELSRREVKRYLARPARQKFLLALAWEHKLDDPESHSSAELTQMLEAKNVDLALAEPDLSDRVPGELPSDRQWAAKRALVEFSLFNRPHFQGTGGTLLEAEEGAEGAIDPGELLTGLLPAELGKLLGDDRPAPPPDVTKKATDAAEKEDRSGVRVTQLLTNAPGQPVKVRGRFLAEMPDGTWAEVWQTEATADPKDVTNDEIDALRDDPQIEKITAALAGLGGGNAPLEQALRQGAATATAQREVNRRFAAFLLRSIRRLDGPTAWSGQ